MAPRRALLDRLLPLVVLVTVLPLGFATYYARVWVGERAGLDAVEQRATLKGVPWFKPEFRRLVDGLEATLPEDAGILVEPHALDEDMQRLTGKTRWFLYLNYYLYPRRVYVRQPKLGSGTLVDYKPWIRHHMVTLDVDGSGRTLAEAIQGERVAVEEDAAILERDVTWRLTYPVSQGFRLDRLHLYERDPAAPEGELVWVERDLRATLGIPARRTPAEGAGGDGDDGLPGEAGGADDDLGGDPDVGPGDEEQP